MSATRISLLVALWCCLWTTLPARAAPPKARSTLETFHQEYLERQLKFTTELEKLAIECDELELADAADSLRSLKVSPDWSSLHLEALPPAVLPPIPQDLPDPERKWRVKLRSLQTDYAAQLYVLANRVLKAGYPGLAYNLVRETAIHDSDHKMARRLLGFVRHRDDWVTPFAAEMLRKQHVWTDDFGWIKAAEVEKYRDGMRNVNGNWVSAEKEAEIRRDFRHAWEVRTDHFLIRTNHSRDQALELGRALEDFYEIFFQTFAGFFNSQEQLQKLFNGAGPEANSARKPYVVHYYRTRQEYLDRLKPDFPQIDVTNGIYLTTNRKTHFYHDPAANNLATLYHEATHQLFYETGLTTRAIGEKSHFWIIEGIACYMESFQRGVQGLSLGDPQYIRFTGARYNRLQDDYYIPLKVFTEMGMKEFQNHPQLVKNYTQASGLAHFFMHYDGGKYRESLVTQLTQLYSANEKKRNATPGLDILTGIPAAQLDREYGEFCLQVAKEIAEQSPADPKSVESGDDAKPGE